MSSTKQVELYQLRYKTKMINLSYGQREGYLKVSWMMTELNTRMNKGNRFLPLL